MEVSPRPRKVGNKSSVLLEFDRCIDVVDLWNEKELSFVHFAQSHLALSLLVHLKLNRRFLQNLSILYHWTSTNFAALHSESTDSYGLKYCENPRNLPRRMSDLVLMPVRGYLVPLKPDNFRKFGGFYPGLFLMIENMSRINDRKQSIRRVDCCAIHWSFLRWGWGI
uniref:Uncharacterized protein n=1 Tax=Cryptomonas curvata TaxID=233186 RepID=A0A7S0QIL4_9CRYP